MSGKQKKAKPSSSSKKSKPYARNTEASSQKDFQCKVLEKLEAFDSRLSAIESRRQPITLPDNLMVDPFPDAPADSFPLSPVLPLQNETPLPPPQVPDNFVEAQPYINNSVPVDSNISPELRATIREGRFVDFTSLLPSLQSEAAATKVTVDGIPISVDRNSRTKRAPLTWHEWLSAWILFQALYISERGQEDSRLAIRMAKHYQQVYSLFRSGGDWRNYDLVFRQLVDRGHAMWGNVHLHLFLESQAKASPAQSTQSSHAIIPGDYPLGFCRMFHQQKFCPHGSNCKFSHQCFNCMAGIHPFVNCRSPVARPFLGANKGNRSFRGSEKSHSSAGAAQNVLSSRASNPSATSKSGAATFPH